MDSDLDLFFIGALGGLAILGFAGCSGGGGESVDPDPAGGNLALQLSELSDVGPDYVYEGWLIGDSGVVSGGRFSVTEGQTNDITLDLDQAAVDGADSYIITIEPAVGDDPAPSSVHVLGGDFAGDSAQLTVSHSGALGTDFADASGSFILATPSTAVADDNHNGIWFLVPGETPTASLELPALPTGWVYEGWVVDGSGPVSTGRFSSPSAADLDGAGATAGPEATPPFPGQDYIDPALDLTDGFSAVITVEPEPDTSAAPYNIKPLITMPISGALAPTAQSLDNQGSLILPGGSAVKL